jgi:spore coat protein X
MCQTYKKERNKMPRTKRPVKSKRRAYPIKKHLRQQTHEDVLDVLDLQDNINTSATDIFQPGRQFSIEEQESTELIFIKESCNVRVQSTDTQAAVSLQIGIQLAIALVLSITIADSERSTAVAQELFQKVHSEQSNVQRVIIRNSKDVSVTTTDTDLAINIQALLQVLVAIIVRLDVL